MAEIDFILNETNYKPFTDEVLGERKACREIKDFINTLVTEKVDLEKEIKEQVNKYYDYCEQKLKEMDDNDNDFSFMTLDNFAKYFFELGLKAQKGE